MQIFGDLKTINKNNLLKAFKPFLEPSYTFSENKSLTTRGSYRVAKYIIKSKCK